MKTIWLLVAAPLTISACAVTDQHAMDEEPPMEGVENCAYLRSVDRMEILDKQHILFFMRDGTIYNNHLRHECPGLRRDDTIMYRTTLNQLCDIDMFTVLEDIGGGFMPGASCSFGKFYPVTQDEVDALKSSQRR